MRPTASPPPSEGDPTDGSARRRLAERTSLGLGGSALSWNTVSSLPQLDTALANARLAQSPVLVLGGGSNLVCADAGFDGAVLEVDLRGVHAARSAPAAQAGPPSLLAPNASLQAPSPLSDRCSDIWLHVAAGEPWDAVVEAACRWGWAGVECLSGIPGKAGATPIQNVGAYGQELGDRLCAVTCVHRASGTLVTFTRQECDLGYRHSRFKGADRDAFVVVEIVLRLSPGGGPSVRYPELIRQLDGADAASLMQVRQIVLTTRRSKSMLLDASDPNGRNCGSFFVNPVVPRTVHTTLQQGRADSVPAFDVDAAHVKIPAAWLIEQAGFARGHRVGNVGVSTKHTLCLVAHDGATTHELLAFARSVRDTVRDRFAIELQPEPVLVGVDW